LGAVQDPSERRRLVRDAATGAILAALCAVVAQVLGVQQMLRRPDLALFVPAALVGAILGVTRLRPILWIGAGTLAVLCVAIGYSPLVSVISRPLVRRDSVPAHVDAIAVLSMGITPDGMMRAETLDRFLSGLELARSGISSSLLVSRERRKFDHVTVSDSGDLQRVASMLAVPVSITFVDSIFTTRTEALRMKELALKNRWDTVAVVTSPLHTRRACATFEAVGFAVVCVPALVRNSGLIPGSSAELRLHSFQSWLYEAFATDTYRRRRWIR
jgi:uncharacterized SAM-binding protein YcdF (DUF218 family)